MEYLLNNRDIKVVAQYIGLSSITKGLSISPLKLQKLLYYVQAWFMVFYGRQNTLFSEVPQAWVNGPVYPSIYNIYKDKVSTMCDHLKGEAFFDGDPVEGYRLAAYNLQLAADQYETIESVIMMYGKQTQNQLIWLSHSEYPWAYARTGLEPFERSNREISLDIIYNYYFERHARNQQKYEA